MTPDENPRVTSDLSPGLLIQALEPLIEAIAEAVVQKIEEKRKIHAVAQAVMAKLAAESERLPEAATNGGADPSGELPPQADDIYRLVAAVLAPRNPPADPAPA